jgi:hypothetical protein
VFSDVKILLVTGRKTQDEDAVLTFAGGSVSVQDKRAGTAAASLPYAAIARATYAHARDPRWDQTLFSPPVDLDVGGMLRTSKHWLVLQTTGSYLVLRLGDSTFAHVLQVLEARTGLTVARPNAANR